MKQKQTTLLAILVTVVLILAGCGTTNEGKTNNKLKVVTTFYPMYDFTKQVVGDKGDVSLLIEAGVEPHDYEPSAKDIATITEADIFVYNSEYFETWVPKVIENIDTTKTTVIDASKGITLKDFTAAEEAAHSHDHVDEEEHDHDHGETHDHKAETDADKNPHVWVDPVLAQQQVKTIAEGIAQHDEKNATTYQENAETYEHELKTLDQQYKDAFAHVSQKTFVTSHAAFGYLANRYGIKQLSIAGLSPDAEPSPKEMAKIKTFVKANKISIIYFEALTSPKLAETLATETGAETVELSPLEGLSEEQQADGLDYIKVMQNNLTALQKSIK